LCQPNEGVIHTEGKMLHPGTRGGGLLGWTVSWKAWERELASLLGGGQAGCERSKEKMNKV